MIGYRVSVALFNIGSSVSKSIWRVKILRMDDKKVTIDDYGSKVKVDRRDVFDTPEAAEAECEKRAEALGIKLLEQLQQRLEELKEPPHKSDRVPGALLEAEAGLKDS